MKKRKFVKEVTNSKIDKIYQMAIKNGAIGGKLTGAGGGGHMLFYCEKKHQSKFVREMKKMNLKHIDFDFYNNGPKIINISG